MVKRYVPKQGDVIYLAIDSGIGHEQEGRRPALVVSADEYNLRSGMILACPITSKQKGYPFEVLIEGKKVGGVALVNQVRAFDYFARKPVFVEKTKSAVMIEVRHLINLLVG